MNNITPNRTFFLTGAWGKLSATPRIRTVLLRPNISVRLALDIPFANREAPQRPQRAAAPARRP